MLERRKSDPQFPFQHPSQPPVEQSCQPATSTPVALNCKHYRPQCNLWYSQITARGTNNIHQLNTSNILEIKKFFDNTIWEIYHHQFSGFVAPCL